VRDGVTPRAGALVLAVLALQLAFIGSYIGAFHEPTPHRIPVAVAAPPEALDDLVGKLDRLPGELPQERVDQETQALRAVSDAEDALKAAQVAYDQAKQDEINTLHANEAALASAIAAADD